MERAAVQAFDGETATAAANAFVLTQACIHWWLFRTKNAQAFAARVPLRAHKPPHEESAPSISVFSTRTNPKHTGYLVCPVSNHLLIPLPILRPDTQHELTTVASYTETTLGVKLHNRPAA